MWKMRWKLSYKEHYRLGQVKVLYPGHAEQLYLEEDEEGSDDPSDHYRSISFTRGRKVQRQMMTRMKREKTIEMTCSGFFGRWSIRS